MPPELRRLFVILAVVVMGIAVVWATRFDSMPPADFSIQNGTDPKTLDPHRATGQPESRVLFGIFSGLLQMLPEGDPDPVTGLQPMSPQPAVAESYDVSDDKLTYTFHLRDDAVWSDGVPITSEDFVWSWTRMLHPATACEYNFQLFSVPFAEQFSSGVVDVGDRCEVELFDRPNPDGTTEADTGELNIQNFPRGTMRYGTLREIRKPPEPEFANGATEEDREERMLNWQESWVFVVDVAEVNESGEVDWDGPTTQQTFTADPDSPVADEDTQRVHNVLVAFSKLGGIETPDDHTLRVNLKDPLPYFPSLTAYYPLFPVPRHVIEKHGMPMWTKAENIVSNGAYVVGMRRLRDRVRLVKNPRWFDADSVAIETIDALSTEGQNTALNMYETGQIDWVTDPPTALMETLKQRDDFYAAPMLSVYFFRMNTTRKPLDDPRVRRAISMAIDRQQIVDQVAKAGQVPAYALVPPGIAGYEPPPGFKPDLAEAKRLLTEAGYPGGRGIPKITVLYNTSEGHRAIAEVVQQQLQNNLNVKLELQNMEWGSFLDKTNQIDYDIARAGWIADYADPNTFLDLWLTDGPQNSTGWSNAEFDRLLKSAAAESDAETRMKLLAEAEAIWIDEMPVIPLYFYVGINMVKPRIKGFFPSPQDLHPLHLMSIDETAGSDVIVKRQSRPRVVAGNGLFPGLPMLSATHRDKTDVTRLSNESARKEPRSTPRRVSAPLAPPNSSSHRDRPSVSIRHNAERVSAQ
ncbi:peptide ABC transporter substrate-binding protein [Rhodopirellula sp. SWK7]|uniref:peptide ABC transporter substrate-binding protein n=1 Tax=Rhodopirellula sp. SWK7 TaxID=595460 RepID=UPI0002BE73B4|nr:peptide ABC transporter substrate-binding protein [Rhodopirellula sp. SWK7]EMI43869.1 oligopeptide ABC transporter, periplasmic oligopeptide-binding protein [Rhodopirellula sp. SWK7]